MENYLAQSRSAEKSMMFLRHYGAGRTTITRSTKPMPVKQFATRHQKAQAIKSLQESSIGWANKNDISPNFQRCILRTIADLSDRVSTVDLVKIRTIIDHVVAGAINQGSRNPRA